MAIYQKERLNMIYDELHKHNRSYAIELLKDYLNHYPKDEVRKLLYVSILLEIGNTEEAFDILNTIQKRGSLNLEESGNYLSAWIKLHILLGNYEDALNMLRTYNTKDIIKENDVYYIVALCKKRLGLKINSSNFNGLIYSQLVSYDEEKVRNYIKENHGVYNEEKSMFNEDFDIDKAFDVISSHMDSFYKIYKSFVGYDCVFKCSHCGKYKGKDMDYIKAVGFIGDNHIAYMAPHDNEDKIPYTDISVDLIDKKLIKKPTI